MRTYRVVTLLAALILMPLHGCGMPTLETRPEQLGETKNWQPTADQLTRKQRSEEQLRAEGVPVNEHLPVIQSAINTKLRNEEDVESRALCLIVVAGKADGLHEKVVQIIVREYGLKEHFSPWENQFIFDDAPSGRDFIAAKWRYESAWALLWALGYIDTLSRPDRMADVPKMVRLITSRNALAFREDAKLRSDAAILDSTDLAYRYHWAVYSSHSERNTGLAELIPSVVHERHHALNWLIGFQGQDWDEISTETIPVEQELML